MFEFGIGCTIFNDFLSSRVQEFLLLGRPAAERRNVDSSRDEHQKRQNEHECSESLVVNGKCVR